MSSGKMDELPLGTTEAAVRSCVSLMAAVFGQPEDLLAYWLDLYFQVRSAYVRENAPEPDPQVITRADLYPVMRELMQDAMKSAAGDGPPRASRTGIASHENPRVALAPTVAEIPGPQTGVKGWAEKKAAIRDRLIAARDQGVTAAQLVTASEQKISDSEIYAILNAAKADMGTYRRLEAALEALGR